MNTTRIGKIARLPRAIRDQLNQRLHDGVPGNGLLEWLNGLPETKAVLAAEFGARPINAQNLSDWKRGGYGDWVAQQEALELAQRLGEDAAELSADGRPPLTDTLALWLAARYAVATRQVAQAEGPEGWRLLRELCSDIVELRRGDHSGERLRLEREQLAQARQRTERERVQEFWEWAAKPEVREKVCRGFMTQPEKIEWLGKLMFGDHWLGADGSEDEPSAADPEDGGLPPAPVAPSEPDSSPIKANQG